jgi:hypothetical protein
MTQTVERYHRAVARFYWVRYHESRDAYVRGDPPWESVVEIGADNHGTDPGRVFGSALGLPDGEVVLVDWQPL